ncbi:MAG: ribosome biogenesis GTP-binding protein YihA/YsxC [Candidatus Muiribacteriota bacterium]|jgi:GTP-binding protein
MKISKVEFLSGNIKNMENRLPEVAIAGRSNSGKSTLINSMINRKIARTSKKPGCTLALNRIRINDCFDLVDLPGYGYAKVSKNVKEKFSKESEKYFLESENLRTVFILMDINTAPAAVDILLINWLENVGRSFILVFNKVDKMPKNKILNKVTEILIKLGRNYPYITISGLKKQNVDKLWNQILAVIN